MKLFQILSKLNKFEHLLILVMVIFVFKLILNQYSFVNHDNCIHYNLYKTTYFNCDNQGSFYNKSIGEFKIPFNVFHIFYFIKDQIFKSLSKSTLVNQLTMTVLFNEKKLSYSNLMIFKYTGIYHLIVISGMHISILIKIIEKLISMLRINNKVKRIIMLSICVFYLFLIKISFPVLYQVIKLETREIKANELNKLIIIACAMCFINYDNFNVLSFYLTIMIQFILLIFNKNSYIAILVIQLSVNILLFKYTGYFNVFSLFYTFILISIFEKFIFPLVITNFILLKFFVPQFLDNTFRLFIYLCRLLNDNFNPLITNGNFSIYLIIILLLSIIYYGIKYENK